MFNYTKKLRKESSQIYWLPLSQISKETMAIILTSLLFALFLSGVNWLLQQSFTTLLAK